MSRISFGKIFASTFEGSLSGAGSDVIALWTYVVAKAEPVMLDGKETGVVMINDRNAAFLIGCPVENLRKALEFLCAPDANSKTKDKEGRRLVKLDEFNYEVVTFMKYRNMAAESPSAVKNRERQKRWQEKQKGMAVPAGRVGHNMAEAPKVDGNGVPGESSGPQKKGFDYRSLGMGPENVFREPDLDEVKEYGRSIDLDGEECWRFWNHYRAKGWQGIVDWRPLLDNWKSRGEKPKEMTLEEKMWEEEKRKVDRICNEP